MMKFEYANDDNIKKKYQEIVNNLSENKKTQMIFNGENLYELGGGHDFIYSFFTEYITKSCVVARHYHYRNFWIINGKEYTTEKDQFIEIIKEAVNYNPINIEDIQFPIVKNVSPKLLSDEIEPMIPKTPPYPKV